MKDQDLNRPQTALEHQWLRDKNKDLSIVTTLLNRAADNQIIPGNG